MLASWGTYSTPCPLHQSSVHDMKNIRKKNTEVPRIYLRFRKARIEQLSSMVFWLGRRLAAGVRLQ